MNETGLSAETHIQVKFFTKQLRYAVPDTPLSVPLHVKVEELSSVINSLLSADAIEESQVEFDFLVDGVFLKTSLLDYVQEKELSVESVLDLEYITRLKGPTPEDAIPHDDWVSAVRQRFAYILTGSYDNQIRILDVEEKEELVRKEVHSAPVKCLAWIQQGDDWRFITGSHDQTLLVTTWSRDINKLHCSHVCRGHAASVDCVAVSPSNNTFCSGSWDKMLKIWSSGEASVSEETEPHRKKKKENIDAPITKTPLATFSSHMEPISGCDWLDERTVVTCSWDHTVRLWDLDAAEEKRKLGSSKVFLSVHASRQSGLLVTSSADRHVRIYDHRVTDGELVQTTLSSHKGWVTEARWSPVSENHLLSVSYDSTAKLWDIRSPKVPQYDLRGHDDKILCCDWSNEDYLLSGGADNDLKIFRYGQ